MCIIINKYAGYIFIFSIAILILILPLSKATTGRKNEPNDPNVTKKIPTEQPEVDAQEFIKAATQGFASSLEMKENVEFLLTPAFLIQEAMSDEILITYPNE